MEFQMKIAKYIPLSNENAARTCLQSTGFVAFSFGSGMVLKNC